MWLFEYFFLNTINLICRSTDISKCFRGSLRFRDNESRLYYQIEGRRREMSRMSTGYLKVRNGTLPLHRSVIQENKDNIRNYNLEELLITL